MQLHYINNPMYALCLLAAVCVRQHVQSGLVQPLTKGVTLQHPTPVLMKPNKAILKTVNDIDEVSKIKLKSTKYPKLEDANALILSVQNYAKRAQRVVGNIRTSIPTKKTYSYNDSFFSYNMPNWVQYLYSNVGVKWFA